MPAQDIMPFRSEHGGVPPLYYFRMGALTTDTTEDTSWEVGYILTLDPSAGDINAEVDGAVAPSKKTTFIAAASSADLIQLHNGTSGAATHNIYVPCYSLADGTEFITRWAYNNSDTELAITAAGGIYQGVTGDLWVDDGTATMVGHRHGFDINGDGCIVTRVLDEQGRDSAEVGAGTGYWLVFKLCDQS
jgi:hypothetical protein